MTFAQMRLWLKEGMRIERRQRARQARAMQQAMWSQGEAFDRYLDALER